MKRSIIELENVSVSYVRDIEAVRGISFTVEESDLAILLGPNGGGKTTIIRTILGVVKPTSGRVRVFGQSIDEFREWWRIGYVPQHAPTHVNQFPINVEELLSASRRSPGSLEIDEVLELVGLPSTHRRKRVLDLSGGHLQRLFVAQALINRPELLILDEPTTHIDQPGQGSLYELLHRLNEEEGMTVLMVSHDISAVSVLASKVICVNKEVFYTGSIDRLFESEEICRLYGFHVYTVRHGHAWE